LDRLARYLGQTVSALIAAIDAERTPDRPLASALRVTALLAAGSGAMDPHNNGGSEPG
jgi:predicted DNA-binding ribbon-helix-helix protein